MAVNSPADLQIVHTRVPKHLVKALKRHAVEQETTLQQLVTDAVEAYIQKLQLGPDQPERRSA